MFIFQLLLRAFSSNLRTVPVGPGEQAALAKQGIHNPTLQRYLAWRRSIFVVVIVTTIVSAGLATGHEYGLFGGDEDVATAQEDGVEEPAEENPKATAFGHFAETVHLVCLYAVPLATLGALICWTRLKTSHRILLAGWAIGSLVPMLIALCPWSWWGYDATDEASLDPMERYQSLAEGVKEGAEYLIMLFPTVMSLIPGAQRACLRIKTLLPESLLPGWFVVAAAPLYSLLILVMFIAINQVASNPLFLGGMFLLLAAPLVFLLRADILTRPLTSNSDYLKLRLVQLSVTGLTVLGGILMLAYLLTQEVFGMRLVGFDDSALLYPTDLPEYGLEFVGRSLFITALGADLFMQMNLSTWRHGKSFSGTPEAEKYDETLSELESKLR